jgi:hypothetical protein
MDINEAKGVLFKGTEGAKRIETGRDNKFVTVDGTDSDEPILVKAFDSLAEAGLIEQLPTAGQVRTTVAYRRGRNHK